MTPSSEFQRGFQFEIPLRANQGVRPQTATHKTVHKFHIGLKVANPPGYLLSDIKRRSLSSLLDRIPRKKEPCYSCLSGRALLLL